MKPENAPSLEKLEGRGGLKLPIVPNRFINSFTVMGYFNNLWELNGFAELSTRSSSSDELVIPASVDKPLIILRRSYRKDPSDHIARWSEGWDNLLTNGYYRYQVLTAPQEDKIGSFDNFININYEYTHGSGRINSVPKPSVRPRDQKDMSWLDYGNEDALSDAYKDLLESFVDLVS